MKIKALSIKTIEIKVNIWEIIIATIIGHIISFIIELLRGINLREVKIDNSELYIDSPGGVWNLLVYYLISTVIFVLLFYFFAFWFRKQIGKLKKVSIIILGVLVIVVSLSFFLTKLMPIAGVENVTEITGSVNNQNSYCYLFVRPIGSAQCWLQNPTPLLLDNDGKWRTEAFFGGTSGSKYELIAIASNTKLELFSKPGAYDSTQIPRNLKQFVRVARII